MLEKQTGRQRLAVLEHHQVPADARLRIVPELAGLDAPSVLQPRYLSARFRLSRQGRAAVPRVKRRSIATDSAHSGRSLLEQYRSIQQAEGDQELRETCPSGG
jgi:hypothetical protein